MDDATTKYVPHFTESEENPHWMGFTSYKSDSLIPHITCECGQNISLENYQVDSEGRVTPEFRHSCGYSRNLILSSWVIRRDKVKI